MAEFPRTKPWWVSIEAWEKIQKTSFKPNKEAFLFEEYFRMGGSLGTGAFIRKGFPDPPVAITPRARELLTAPPVPGGPPRELPRGVTVSEPPTPEQVPISQRVAEIQARRVDLRAPTPPTGFDIPEFPTQAPPPGFEWRWNPNVGRYEPRKLEEKGGFRPPGGVQKISITDNFGNKAFWNERTGDYDYPPNWGQRPADQPAPAPLPPPISPFQEQTLDIQQQQLQFQQDQAQMQADLQREQERARLAANPINWLQFAAFTGEEPVVQPWMIPLGFQQFGGTPQGGTIAPQGTQPTGGAFTQAGQQLQVGQPIPGLQGTEFTGLPQLRTPSAQLQARWGPTAQAQFLGFEQARTGAAPQETQFRLGAGRAPTGRFGGFSRFR